MERRHWVLALLVLLSIITFLDRLCIAAAGPLMQDELKIPPEKWGLVLGAFVLAYGLFEIPTGVMGDRFGHRSTLTRIVLWWSGFTMLTGAMSSFVPLVIVRFLFGAGEAGAYPNMAGVISRWFPVGERARAQGFVWGASRAGGALAPLVVVPVQSAFGWRAAFYVFGAIGIVWCAVWWFWYRDAKEPLAASSGSHSTTPWRELFSSRQMWLIVVMYGSYAWGSWFYFSWLHTYLVKGRGFSSSEMAVFAALPFAVGAVSNVIGGYLCDFAVLKLGQRLGRTILGSTCLTAGALLLILTSYTKDKNMAVVLLTLGFGVMDLMLPSAWAICLDIGGKHAGAVSGAMNSSGQFGGFLCTVLFGFLAGQYNDYDLPLRVIAVMLLIAAALFTRIDPTKPILSTGPLQ